MSLLEKTTTSFFIWKRRRGNILEVLAFCSFITGLRPAACSTSLP